MPNFKTEKVSWILFYMTMTMTGKRSIIEGHLMGLTVQNAYKVCIKMTITVMYVHLTSYFGCVSDYSSLTGKIFQHNMTTEILCIKQFKKLVSYRTGFGVVIALPWRVWVSLVSPGLELDVVQPPPSAKAFPLPVSVSWRWLELLKVLLQEDWEVG